jgi:hypothetical protein
MARFVALTLIIELDINLPLLMDSIDFLHIVGRVSTSEDYLVIGSAS